MRIIELEIIGFGKLSDKKYNFDNITSILQSNGEGKSTLACFIESMFYGIDAKGSTLREYKPWASDFFGGNITISVGDKIYRIERTFGTKKSDDTFKIYLMPEKKPTLPVATVPRPVMVNTSSTGIRKGLSVSRSGAGM